MAKNKNLPLPPIEVIEDLARKLNDLKMRFGQSLKPIVLQDSLTGLLEPFASSVLFKIDDYRFVFSAAHVLEKTKTYRLKIWTGSDYAPLLGKVCSTFDPAHNIDDSYDISVISLFEETHSRIDDADFLSLEDIDLYEVNRQDRIYVAFGFPGALSSSSDFGTQLNLKPITNSGAGRPQVLKQLKLSPETHIALEFDRFNSLKDGKGETVPKPPGMSGGPVFRLDHTGQKQDKLVGVLTTWLTNSSAILATNVGVCLGAISALHSDLNNHFPRWRVDLGGHGEIVTLSNGE